MNTITFKTKDWQLTVKKEFQAVAEQAGIALKDLKYTDDQQNTLARTSIDYLHNETGPAAVHLKTGTELYILNGEEVSGEIAEKIKRDFEFSNKLTNILEEK